MATYKKKASTNKKNNITNIEEHSTTAEVFNTLDETASKSEHWVEKNQRPLLIGLLAIALAIIGYIAYNKFVLEPKEKEAADELAFPKKSFEQALMNEASADSLFTIALNGGDGKFGLVDIVDNYGNTKAGNLAKYMSGIAFMKKSDYENAIKYLNDFESDDEILGTLAKGNIGDAFTEINQPEDALKYYEDAANLRDNEFTSPLYLFKAGQTAMDMKNYDKAVALFEKIKKEYPLSEEAKQIDVFIQRAKLAVAK